MAARRMEAAWQAAATDERDSWLCRSTIGAASDVDADEDEEQVEAQAAEERSSAELKPTKPKLALGHHWEAARAHALRQEMPAAPTPVFGLDVGAVATPSKRDTLKLQVHKAQRPTPTLARDESATKRMKPARDEALKKKADDDSHLPIYMHYDRPDAAPHWPQPRKREEYVVRHAWGVHAALFLSTAVVHCASFNVSPAVRRLFAIEKLPVGLCIVVAWTLLGLLSCVGVCVGTSDRVGLLRLLSWIWLGAIVELQLVKILPLEATLGNVFLAIGYAGAMAAHGLLVPHTITVGAEMVAARVKQAEANHRRRRARMDAAMSSFFTRAFGAMMAASSLVQVFYFVAVELDGPSERTGVLVLRSLRAALVTLPCAVGLLSLIITFLFHSRHHSLQTEPPTLSGLASAASTDTPPLNTLERKLAVDDLEHLAATDAAQVSSTRLAASSWLRLARRSSALVATVLFVLAMLLSTVAALLAHVLSPLLSASPLVVHIVIASSLFVGWVMTLLVATSQLPPTARDKIYSVVAGDDNSLPTRKQLFVAVALLCLSSTAAFAAFVRAQLYSTMFIQSCQLRHRSASAALDPNTLGAFVGLASLLLLPVIRVAVRPMGGRATAVRRIAVSVLLYLVSAFFSSVVELYRRDSRRPALALTGARLAGCRKTHASDFDVLWSVPHLVLLALADAMFRVGAAEEAHALTASLGWTNVAHAAMALADSVGYSAAIALSTTLSSWLYRAQASDLVLLLLLITTIGALAYAMVQRLAHHILKSRCRRRQMEEETQEEEEEESESAKHRHSNSLQERAVKRQLPSHCEDGKARERPSTTLVKR